MVIAVINYDNCAFEMLLPYFRGVLMEDRREVNMSECLKERSRLPIFP